MGVVREANIRSLLAMNNAFLGNESEALEYASRAAELQPENSDWWSAGGIYSNLYTTYMVLGDNDRALEILTFLAENGRGPSSGWAQMHPSYDGLRQDARFAAAVEQRRGIERPVM